MEVVGGFHCQKMQCYQGFWAESISPNLKAASVCPGLEMHYKTLHDFYWASYHQLVITVDLAPSRDSELHGCSSRLS